MTEREIKALANECAELSTDAERVIRHILLTHDIVRKHDADINTAHRTEFLSRKIQISNLCAKLHIDTAQLIGYIDDTISEWELTDTLHTEYSDWSKHMINTIRIKHRANETDQTDKLARRRGTEPSAASRKGFKGTF